MRTRSIGSIEVSAVGVGCNNFGSKVVGKLDAARTNQVVDAALDAGVTFFDTSDSYGGGRSEELLGHALGRRREDVVIATKFGSRLDDERKGARPEYVKRAVQASLVRLGTDYIDLYQLHRPDPETPIADTLGAMHELVEAGTVREIGCSNFSVAQLEEAQHAGVPGFVALQNEYSLLNRSAEFAELAWCRDHGLAFVPYYPLFNGLLSGKYRRDAAPPEDSRIAGMSEERQRAIFTAENFDRVERFQAFAVERGYTVLELSIAWLLAKTPVASVVVGATSPAQVRANAAAASRSLTDAEVAKVDGLVP